MTRSRAEETWKNFSRSTSTSTSCGSTSREVLEGFWFTIKLSILAGILSLLWGLILAVLRQTPGKFGAIIRWPTIAYIDVMRGLPQLIIILLVFGFFGELADSGLLPAEIAIPRWLGQPDPFWYGALAITLSLRRLHG